MALFSSELLHVARKAFYFHRAPARSGNPFSLKKSPIPGSNSSTLLFGHRYQRLQVIDFALVSKVQ
jgi:hypothetical protein